MTEAEVEVDTTFEVEAEAAMLQLGQNVQNNMTDSSDETDDSHADDSTSNSKDTVPVMGGEVMREIYEKGETMTLPLNSGDLTNANSYFTLPILLKQLPDEPKKPEQQPKKPQQL